MAGKLRYVALGDDCANTSIESSQDVDGAQENVYWYFSYLIIIARRIEVNCARIRSHSHVYDGFLASLPKNSISPRYK